MAKRKTIGMTDALTHYLEDFARSGVTELGHPKPRRPAGVSNKGEKMNKTERKTESEPETVSEEWSETAAMLHQVVQKIKPALSASRKGTILNELAAVVATCSVCPELAANRTQTVFGVGNPAAELLFVGEGPGADEDRQGIPFVGRSGQLLTDIITKGMKIRREDVYICNIVRCRPPGNRNPTGIEAQCCRPFLDATLEVIAPKFICCLGAVAATNLLETTEPIGRLRGKVHDYKGAKVVCTYHPAYLLRNPPAKAQTWEDIKLLLRTMGR